MLNYSVIERTRFRVAIFIILIITVLLSFGFSAKAEGADESTTIRVGFFENAGYHDMEEDGTLSGYGYEVMRLLAPYGNFKYEYVGYDKTWSEMMDMLEKGEIDLLTPAQKTPERQQKFSFVDTSIGTSSTIVVSLVENEKIQAGNLSSLDGSRVGVLKGSNRAESFVDHMEKYKINYSLKYYDTIQDMKQAALYHEIDVLVENSFHVFDSRFQIIESFDDEPFYIMVRKGNIKLQDRLNNAIRQLNIISPKWKDDLESNYYGNNKFNIGIVLSDKERDYLKYRNDNEPLKIMINPDRAPYSSISNGKPDGIIFDLLESAAAQCGYKYELIETRSTKEYNDYMDANIPDVVFDCPSLPYTADLKGYNVTDSYYGGDFAILRRKGDSKMEVVAVKKGASSMNARYNSLYGKRILAEYDSLDACVQAVKNKEADCCYMYTYTAANYVSADYRGMLEYTPVRGMQTDFRIAVRQGEPPELFAVMNKFAKSVTSNEMQRFITNHTSVNRPTFLFYVYQNPLAVVVVIATMLALVFGIILYNLEKRRIEQKEKDAQIRQIQSMLKQVTEAFPMGIFAYIRKDNRVLVANKETCRLLGKQILSDNIDLKENVLNNLVDGDRELVFEAMKGLEKVGDEVEFLFRTKQEDGEIAYVLCCSKWLEMEDGTEFMLSGMNDVTTQIFLNKKLESEQSQFREALVKNANSFYTFDVTEGYINSDVPTRNGNMLLGQFELEAPIKFDDLYQICEDRFGLKYTDDSYKELFRTEGLLKMYASGQTSMLSELYLESQDKYFSSQILLSKDVYTNHILATVINKDITEIRKNEIAQKQLLIDSLAATDRANEAKTNFLSHMSHDIRTPMNAIIGMTTIAESHLEDRNRVEDCLSKIKTASNHLLNLINEVLDMSKIESGKIDLHEENFELSTVIDNLIILNKAQIEEKKQNFSVGIKNVDHEFLVGDVSRIQKVFMNLISNAIKYTPEGGRIELNITEKLSGRNNIACFEFEFKDNGIGMTKEFQKHIFEPFVRAEDSRISKIQGTGLGMAISKHMVSTLGGTIQVESKINKGSKFTITLNLKIEEGNSDNSCELINGHKVLVIASNSTNCAGDLDILQENGIETKCVHSKVEAIAAVRMARESGDNYSAILVEWEPEKMDVVSLAQAIRKEAEKDTVIAITSMDDWAPIETEAKEAGVNIFIGKPLFKTRIRRLFVSHIDNTQEVEESSLMENNKYKGRRVLVVEDNELNAEIAGEMLEMYGLLVEFASDGKEAVDKVSKAPEGYFDIILMDVQMPVMNGYEATKAIRKLSGEYVKKVPILAMTANAFAEDVQMSRSAGMNEHIAKPINQKVLANVLEKWLSDESK